MWSRRSFGFKTVITSVFLTSILVGVSESNEVEKLPYCPDGPKIDDPNQRLVFVSTLDGRLTALNAANNGALQWSISTGPGPMLSSSIHRLELTNSGQWVRMIPSLSGGLYKFNGDNVEAIPITADSLLRSSFRYSDDLVIAGGKEIRSYGVSMRSGKLIYECSMQGCRNITSEEDGNTADNLADYTLDEVLVVQRQTQTVRAVEPRTGTERWNFSVGQHELQLSRSNECGGKGGEQIPMDLEYKVIVPEGLLCAVRRSQPNVVLWKHKFDAPIVSAWEDTSDSLRPVDLFSGAQWSWSPQGSTAGPSLYIGMHKKQLYVQESVNIQKLVQTQALQYQQHLITDETRYPRIPWKPYPATSSALILWGQDEMQEHANDSGDNSVQLTDPIDTVDVALVDSQSSTTALSVLYGSEYVNGNGFYLYTTGDLNQTSTTVCDKPNITIEADRDSEEYDHNGSETDYEYTFDNSTPVNVIVVSLWYWWKEVLIISITSALLLNLLVTQHYINKPPKVLPVSSLPLVHSDTLLLPSNSPSEASTRSLSESTNSNSNSEFVSRFLTDFDPLTCLGKGGFGVVFEAKNKIDDCNYAIKRITLPNRQDSRERVMREVKALAKLEHNNIVRYFNAWLENPPVGWQEQADNTFILKDISVQVETPSATESKLHSLEKLKPLNNNKTDIYFNSFLTNDQFTDSINSFRNVKTLPKAKSKSLCEDLSDSYIVFEAASKDSQSRNSILDVRPQDYESSYKSSNVGGNDSFIIFENSKYSDNSKSIPNGFSVPLLEVSSIKSGFNLTITEETGVELTSDAKKSKLKKGHKRPQSLDLTSNGSVLLPCSKVYLYIQMQLCRKESLKEWLLRNTFEVRCSQVVSIWEQIVGAVEYVHLQGLIHRDLKPSNIFFSLDGQIKIGDFGLVTAMAESPLDQRTPCENRSELEGCDKHTQQVGTHLYMSPEQLQGRPYNYKVDIYSLGLILFELLVQFSTEMERIATLQKLRNNKFPPEFQHKFANEFDLLRVMLSQEPTKRPTTYGIKARPPLNRECNKTEWHFELPPRSRSSSLAHSLESFGTLSCY